jgi:hypothetical protein
MCFRWLSYATAHRQSRRLAGYQGFTGSEHWQ